jgi:hypothetical protein
MNTESIDILSPVDVEILLDTVYSRLIAREVPDEYPYRLLAAICKPGIGLITANTGNNVGMVNTKVQNLVCQQLLGPPFPLHKQSPFWSMMTYRTATSSNNLPGKRPEILISTTVFGQCRPSGHSGIYFNCISMHVFCIHSFLRTSLYHNLFHSHLHTY